jgi:hypothetical protein
VTFVRTYEMEPPPEAPMKWLDYEQLVVARWNELLASVPAASEDAVHAFLEQHPCMVPGAFNITE